MSSQIVWKGKFLQVSIVDNHYEVVNRPQAVGIIATDDMDNIVLVRQYRPAIKQWTLEIPAGLINKGEDPIQTAIREFREETGYSHVKGSEKYLGYMYPTVGFSDEILHFVKLKVDKNKYLGQMLDEGENISDVLFMSIEEFVEKCKRLEFSDSKTLVSALLVVY